MPQPKGANGVSVQTLTDDAVLAITIDAATAAHDAGLAHADTIAGLQRIARSVNKTTSALQRIHDALGAYIDAAERAEAEYQRRRQMGAVA